MLRETDVVVPVFNEEGTLPEFLGRLRQACPGAQLIFVDNASTDRSRDILEAEPGIRLVCHDRNLGYGQSLINGTLAGTGANVVQIDADLEYQPEDVPALVEALADAGAAYGSRFAGDREPPGMSATRRLGNRSITGLFNALYTQRLSDLYTGLRAFRRELLVFPCHRAGFEYVLEVGAGLARGGVAIADVPIEYRPRRSGTSKMRHFREALRFAYWLLRFRMGPRSPELERLRKLSPER